MIKRREISSEELPRRSYRADSRRASLIVALIAATCGLTGVAVSALLFNIVLFFLFVEIISVALFFILCIILISTSFPKSVKASSIFFSGLGNPPYIQDEEVLTPPIPLLRGGYDSAWENYYDADKVEVEEEK